MSNCSHNPSRLRRQGRNDFDPFVDPMDVQPFNENSWWYANDLENWLEGWFEADHDFENDDSDEGCCPCCGQVIE